MIFKIAKKYLNPKLNLIHNLTQLNYNSYNIDNLTLVLNSTELKIIITNISFSAQINLIVDSNSNANFQLNAKLFLEIIKKFPGEEINFKIKKDILEIYNKNIKYSLNIKSKNEKFKNFEITKDFKEINFESHKLKSYLENSLFAVNKNDSRIALTGVFFKINFNELTIVATNGIEFVKITDNISNEYSKIEFIIPKEILSLIKNYLEFNQKCQILYNQDQIIIKFANIKIISKTINKKYPEYQGIIPQENYHEIILAKEKLLNSLNRVYYTVAGKSLIVKLRFYNKNIEINASNDYFFYEEVITTNNFIEKEKMIEIDYLKLREMISTIESENIIIKTFASKKLILLEPYSSISNKKISMILFINN